MRYKLMPRAEFEAVLQRNWVPLQLAGAAIPSFLRGIPPQKLCAIYASGGPYALDEYQGLYISSGELIGGIDVFRYAPDDPVNLNKDWYPVIKSPDSDVLFLVAGPRQDEEHWVDEIPVRLVGAEVLWVPGRTWQIQYPGKPL